MQVLKRVSKTTTHVVFGAGGDGNAAVSGLDEGAALVGASWVAACEAARGEAPLPPHLLAESSALRLALQHQEEAEEEQQQTRRTKTKKTKTTTKKKKRAGTTTAVPRDASGAAVLPLTVGAVTVSALGALAGRGAAFHAPRALYPVGYAAEALRVSHKHPPARVRYCFSVEAAPDDSAPLFRAVCMHDPANPIVGASPSEVCMRVATLLAEARQQPPPTRAPRGEDWFGLSNPTVRALLQELPGAENREGYQPLLPDNHDDENEDEEQEEEENEEENEAAAEEKPKKKKKQKKMKLKAGAAPEVRAAKRAEKEAARAKREEEEAAKRAAKAAEEEKKAEKKRLEQERKKQEQEKRQQEQEAKKREKEEAAAKKEAGQMKLTTLVVMKRDDKTMASASATAAASSAAAPVRQVAAAARVDGDELVRMIREQQQTEVNGIPADYLAWARGCKRRARRAVPLALRTLRFWDDSFRPAFSVRAASYRLAPPLSGRCPTAKLATRDYEDESDDDWEGWDEQEESLGDEDPEEAEEQAEEDEKGFVVPDTMIELEDGQLVSDVQALPPRAEARRRVPEAVRGARDSSYAGVALCALPVAPGARPPEWPLAAAAAAESGGALELDVSSSAPTPAAGAPRRAKTPRAPSAEATACVREALEQQQQQQEGGGGGAKSALLERAAALFVARHPALPRPTRAALERALGALAEYNGRAWTLRPVQPTLLQTIQKQD